ncbi:MAG: hypothetical protein GY832_14980 [Chloroflexi bacterium]|nr:hypothetical protein [Chloroflexota bacterium]
MKDNKLLVVILAVLTVSVLLTSGLVVYVVLTREGGEVVDDGVTDPVITVAPTVAMAVPDEPHIAFVSDQDGDAAIYVIDTDGTNQQRVSEPDRDFCIRPYWSPDGQRVAYLEGQGVPGTQAPPDAKIWVSAVDGSEHVHVSHAVPNILQVEPTWSPDGTRMAFASVAESARDDYFTSTLHIVAMDGSIEQSIPLSWMLEFFIWSPVRDQWLLIGDPAEAEISVYILSSNESNGEKEIIEIFHGAIAAGWSPDGEAVVVGDYTSNTIFILRPDQEPQPVAELEMDPVEIAWSPDGTHIAVTGARNRRQGYGDTLHIVTVDTGEITTVVENEGFVVWPSWSPDGSHLLFTMGPLIQRTGADLPFADLWVYDVASDGMEQLTMGAAFNGLGVWSP